MQCATTKQQLQSVSTEYQVGCTIQVIVICMYYVVGTKYFSLIPRLFPMSRIGCAVESDWLMCLEAGNWGTHSHLILCLFCLAIDLKLCVYVSTVSNMALKAWHWSWNIPCCIRNSLAILTYRSLLLLLPES